MTWGIRYASAYNDRIVLLIFNQGNMIKRGTKEFLEEMWSYVMEEGWSIEEVGAFLILASARYMRDRSC